MMHRLFAQDVIEALVAEPIGAHVLVRHRDEAAHGHHPAARVPGVAGALLVLVSERAQGDPSLVGSLPALLRPALADAGARSLWLGLPGLARDPAARRLAGEFEAELFAPDGPVVTTPGAVLYAGHGTGGTGWWRVGDEVSFACARWPAAPWESLLPTTPVTVGDLVVEPVPAGILVRTRGTTPAPRTALTADPRHPKVLVDGAVVPTPASVAPVLARLRPGAIVVPAVAEICAHTWQHALSTHTGADVLFTTTPTDAAYPPFPTLLRQHVDGAQQVVEIAPAPRGWVRHGVRAYRPLDNDNLLAEVVPSGLALHPPTTAAAIAPRPFDPAGWRLYLGNPGEPLDLATLAAADTLLGALDPRLRATVQVEVLGDLDPQAEATLARSRTHPLPVAVARPAAEAVPSTVFPPARPVRESSAVGPRPLGVPGPLPFPGEPAVREVALATDSGPAGPVVGPVAPGPVPFSGEPAVREVALATDSGPAGPVVGPVAPGPVPFSGEPAVREVALATDSGPAGPVVGPVAPGPVPFSGEPAVREVALATDSGPAGPVVGPVAPGPVPFSGEPAVREVALATDSGPAGPVVEPVAVAGPVPFSVERPAPEAASGAVLAPARPVPEPVAGPVPAPAGRLPMSAVPGSGISAVRSVEVDSVASGGPPVERAVAPVPGPVAVGRPPVVVAGAPVAAGGPPVGAGPAGHPPVETASGSGVGGRPPLVTVSGVDSAVGAGPIAERSAGGPSAEGAATVRLPVESMSGGPAVATSSSVAPAAAEATPLVLADRVSTAAEQARFTASTGEVFGEALAMVNAALATWPSLRQGDSAGIKADYVAVCLYLGRGAMAGTELNQAVRAGDGAGVVDLLPCLVSGIRRLPVHRRAVLRQGRLGSAEHRATPGAVLTEPGFLSASMDLDVAVAGADLDVLIWPTTARRTSELVVSRPVREAVFSAAGRFKALAVRTAEGEEDPDREGPPPPRVAALFRELAPGELPTTTELDEQDLAVLAKLDRVLARRQRATLRLVDDQEAADRLTSSLVRWQHVSAERTAVGA
ncbi:hypothetical protein ACOBQX_03915 [Actinokineospora sp. G85]|uniref:hypothetical protein n=1 Tax=Actinokineospora sp. G85 TaxID=3406626 RepID=UPI003C78A373